MTKHDNDQYLQLLALQEMDIALNRFLSFVNGLFPMRDEGSNRLCHYCDISLTKLEEILLAQELYSEKAFWDIFRISVIQAQNDFWKLFVILSFHKTIKEMVLQMDHELYGS